MPHLNKIVNMQLLNVSGNGSVNMGSSIVVGMAANSQGVGGQSFIGERFISPLRHDGAVNVQLDPDLNDQQQNQV